MGSQAIVDDGTKRKKLDVRRGKGTARDPVLKHQGRDKDTAESIKGGDTGRKRKAWVPPEASTGGGGPHGRI